MDNIEVNLVDTMGNDLRVVNAARVSFNKESEYEHIGDDEHLNPETKEIELTPRYRLSERDQKLINYLAKHDHWTPFSHVMMTFRIKAPIFVARQLFKHQVGLTVNEVSRRYVDTEPEYYFPEAWRLKAKNKKQGSSNKVLDSALAEPLQLALDNFVHLAFQQYEEMLAQDIAPELARMILPQNVMTEWFWTGSLAAFSRVCQLRLGEDAQYETRLVAEKISEFAGEKFPVSWKALRDTWV